jgi:hypothetical protein
LQAVVSPTAARLVEYGCGCAVRVPDRWRLCPYHEGFDACAEQADDLQAKIDDYATARQRCRDSVALSHATYAAACDALYMAEDALLAAATPKEAES